jgi:hypothetical protein
MQQQIGCRHDHIRSLSQLLGKVALADDNFSARELSVNCSRVIGNPVHEHAQLFAPRLQGTLGFRLFGLDTFYACDGYAESRTENNKCPARRDRGNEILRESIQN